MPLSSGPTIVLLEGWRQNTLSNKGAAVLRTCVVQTSGSRRNACRDTILRWRNVVCRYSLDTWSREDTQMTAGITERAASCNCVQFPMEYFVTTIRLRLGPGKRFSKPGL